MSSDVCLLLQTMKIRENGGLSTSTRPEIGPESMACWWFVAMLNRLKAAWWREVPRGEWAARAALSYARPHSFRERLKLPETYLSSALFEEPLWLEQKKKKRKRKTTQKKQKKQNKTKKISHHMRRVRSNPLVELPVVFFFFASFTTVWTRWRHRFKKRVYLALEDRDVILLGHSSTSRTFSRLFNQPPNQ